MIVPLYYANTGQSGTSCPSRRETDGSVLVKALLPQKPLRIWQGPDAGAGASSDRPSLALRDEHTRTSLMGGSQLAGRDGKAPGGNWPCRRSGTVAGTPHQGRGLVLAPCGGHACVLSPPSVQTPQRGLRPLGFRTATSFTKGFKQDSEDTSANAWKALLAHELTLGTM